jgi:hypothetical protein
MRIDFGICLILKILSCGARWSATVLPPLSPDWPRLAASAPGLKPPSSTPANRAFCCPPLTAPRPSSSSVRPYCSPPASRSASPRHLRVCSSTAHRSGGCHPAMPLPHERQPPAVFSGTSSHLVGRRQPEAEPRRPLLLGQAPAASSSGRSRRPRPLAGSSPT